MWKARKIFSTLCSELLRCLWACPRSVFGAHDIFMIPVTNILRLGKGALIAALVTLTLCTTMSAQGVRPETGPHNLSPAVGTGGPEGGGPKNTSCIKFDEYDNLKINDELARLDNFAIQLQRMPRGQGYYFIFGSCEGEAAERAQRAVDYLVSREIDRDRITVVNGGCRETLTVELWICPKGGIVPIPGNIGTVDPCPKCKPMSKPSRRGHRRGRHPRS
jgi:hypothetical protein